MSLAAAYAEIKLAHVALVAASGGLFAVRGAAVLAGQRWAMLKPLRVASYLIDTLLLTAGATLWTLLALQPLRDGWLGTKLVLLAVYVVLGSLALKRGRTQATRAAAYVAALAVFLFMVSVARAHDARGLFAAWAS
ncbi:regulator SirB [Rubrivivax gelatinosus]|nr:regulator SirB [Rubrivivax gelatinosus]